VTRALSNAPMAEGEAPVLGNGRMPPAMCRAADGDGSLYLLGRKKELILSALPRRISAAPESSSAKLAGCHASRSGGVPQAGSGRLLRCQHGSPGEEAKARARDFVKEHEKTHQTVARSATLFSRKRRPSRSKSCMSAQISSSTAAHRRRSKHELTIRAFALHRALHQVTQVGLSVTQRSQTRCSRSRLFLDGENQGDTSESESALGPPQIAMTWFRV